MVGHPHTPVLEQVRVDLMQCGINVAAAIQLPTRGKSMPFFLHNSVDVDDALYAPNSTPSGLRSFLQRQDHVVGRVTGDNCTFCGGCRALIGGGSASRLLAVVIVSNEVQ